MMKAMGIVLALAVISASAHAGDLVEVNCNPRKNSTKKATLQSGDTLVVRAEGNPTTGYTWTSREGYESEYTRASEDDTLIGGGGIYYFNINGSKLNDGDVLVFEYKRSFEKKSGVICKVNITKN